MGEGIMSFEIDGDCDIVRRGGCCDFTPEKELVCIGEFG
jgi:hypothetical protein